MRNKLNFYKNKLKESKINKKQMIFIKVIKREKKIQITKRMMKMIIFKINKKFLNKINLRIIKKKKKINCLSI